ncbi:MAG: hypothetical protein V1809_03880 [Planctomycetota bacterium]
MDSDLKKFWLRFLAWACGAALVIAGGLMYPGGPLGAAARRMDRQVSGLQTELRRYTPPSGAPINRQENIIRQNTVLLQESFEKFKTELAMILPPEYRIGEKVSQPGLFFSQRVSEVAKAVRQKAGKKGVRLGSAEPGKTGDDVQDYLGFKQEAEGALDLDREVFETLLLQLGVKRQLAEIAVEAGVEVVESLEHRSRDLTGPREYPTVRFIHEFPVRMVVVADFRSLLTLLHNLRDRGRYFLVRELTVETREGDPRLGEGEIRVTIVVAGMTFVPLDKGKFPGLPPEEGTPGGGGTILRPRNYE